MNERDWSGHHRGTTAEQQAYYAPLAWELMRAPDFHGKSYEHLLVEHEAAVALLREAENIHLFGPTAAMEWEAKRGTFLADPVGPE